MKKRGRKPLPLLENDRVPMIRPTEGQPVLAGDLFKGPIGIKRIVRDVPDIPPPGEVWKNKLGGNRQNSAFFDQRGQAGKLRFRILEMFHHFHRRHHVVGLRQRSGVGLEIGIIPRDRQSFAGQDPGQQPDSSASVIQHGSFALERQDRGLNEGFHVPGVFSARYRAMQSIAAFFRFGVTMMPGILENELTCRTFAQDDLPGRNLRRGGMAQRAFNRRIRTHNPRCGPCPRF